MWNDNLFEYLSLSFTIASLFFSMYEDPEIQNTMLTDVMYSKYFKLRDL